MSITYTKFATGVGFISLMQSVAKAKEANPVASICSSLKDKRTLHAIGMEGEWTLTFADWDVFAWTEPVCELQLSYEYKGDGTTEPEYTEGELLELLKHMYSHDVNLEIYTVEISKLPGTVRIRANYVTHDLITTITDMIGYGRSGYSATRIVADGDKAVLELMRRPTCVYE